MAVEKLACLFCVFRVHHPHLPSDHGVLVGAGVNHTVRLLDHVISVAVPLGHGGHLLSALEERQEDGQAPLR